MHISAITIIQKAGTLTYQISEGVQAKFGKFKFNGDGKIKLHVLRARI